VPPSDPVALRQAMQYLWEHPEQAIQMGQRAEARYWQHFTADQMVQSYVDVYADLVKHGRIKNS
jgi:rhamnosyl/mannosyltransferase